MRYLLTLLLCCLFSINAHSENIPSVKIGIIVPLSGELAYVGEDIRQGILFGIDRVKDSISITPVFEDNAYDSKLTATAAHKLISIEKVNVLITLWEGADVAAPIAEKAHVLHLSIRWNSNVTKDRPLTFTFESTYKSFAENLLQLLKLEQIKKIAVILNFDVGWVLAVEETKKLASNYGVEVTEIEEINKNDTDFRTIITKLVSKNPDSLVLFTNPPATQIIIKQLNQIRPGFKHTGYYGTLTESDFSLIENMPFVDQFQFSEEFKEKFKAKFGALPKIRAAHAYELMRLIDWAYKKLAPNEPATSENLALKLSTLKDFESSLGRISVNSTRNIEHPNIWRVYRNGVFNAVPIGGKLP